MANVICPIHRKGGVGKTTIAFNLPPALLEKTPPSSGRTGRALLIDLDSQASLSKLIAGEEAVRNLRYENTTVALFDDNCNPTPELLIHDTQYDNIKLVPACTTLDGWNLPRPLTHGAKQFALRDFIETVTDKFDWIFLDPPPNSSVLPAWNCLMAANYLIAVVNTDRQSSDGIMDLEQMISTAVMNGNPALRLLGFLVNDREKNKAHTLYENKYRSVWNQQMYRAVLEHRVVVQEASAMGQHLLDYDRKSSTSKQLLAIAEETVERIQYTKHTLGKVA